MGTEGLCPGSSAGLPSARAGSCLPSPHQWLCPSQTGLAELSVAAERTTLLPEELTLSCARDDVKHGPGSAGGFLQAVGNVGTPRLLTAGVELQGWGRLHPALLQNNHIKEKLDGLACMNLSAGICIFPH